MLKYIFLAFIQGITEFLPVSSSGHLAFFQMVLGFDKPMIKFDTLLHVATVLAVIVFLRREISLICRDLVGAGKKISAGKKIREIWAGSPNLKIFLLVIAAFIPTAVIGLLFHSLVENMFGSLNAIAVMFFITGIVLFVSKFSRERKKEVSLIDALSIGFAQALAVIPGISRSGFTICAGLFRGLDRQLAAKFSFLLSIPTIFAAAVYEMIKNPGAEEAVKISSSEMLISFLVAFLSGYLAVVVLYKIISRSRLHVFAYYCWLMSALSIGVLSFLQK